MPIIIFANSPGEIASWVKPVITRINAVLPNQPLIIVTPPCQWRSGGETNYCHSLGYFKRIIEPREYLRYLVQPGFLPELNRLPSPSVIIFLGGELFYPWVLHRRTGVPLIGYRQDGHYPADKFQRLFVPSERVRKLLVRQDSFPSNVEVVGNLMIDSCPSPSPHWRRSFDPSENGQIVSLFPGSRQSELSYMLPFFIQTVESMIPLREPTRFFLALSPFASTTDLENILKYHGKARNHSIKSVFSREPPGAVMRTDQGMTIEVVQGRHHELMAVSDLMITIPGTKTMEAACYGTPMLVVTPLQQAEAINIGGPIDFLSYIPGFGKPLKRYLLKQTARRISFTALPNIAVNQLIVPEMVGTITPAQVAREARILLSEPDRCTIMRKTLLDTAGSRGAAERIAEYCVELLGH